MNQALEQHWLCSQIGAREHYAIPRALRRAGRLRGFWTDFWAPPGSAWARLGGSRCQGRHHTDLADFPVAAFNAAGLLARTRIKVATRRNPSPYDGFLAFGSWFSRRLGRELDMLKLDGDELLFFGYDTAFLEAAEQVKQCGGTCVLGQMDPGRVETERVQEEVRRWPGWERRPLQVPEAYFRRREAEWQLADRIVVNSRWSRKALVQQGVPAEKIHIIPLAYELPEKQTPREDEPSAPREFTRQCPLRVLFLGQVILRKGMVYLMQAARLLEKSFVRFEVVGPVGLSAEAVRSAPGNLHFHGPVPRADAAAWYARADVFVLPTLSDGFALTQLEAMAHGLPVIATPCCGDVVTDGTDGLLVEAGSAQSLAEAIRRYLEAPEILAVHRRAARAKAGEFGLERLTKNLLALASNASGGSMEGKPDSRS